MSNSRFQYAYRENASKLHKAVGEILRTSDTFCNYEAYQEYPVNRVNETYPESSHHFDWVVPGFKLVIECHGKQHYAVTDWEGGKAQEAMEAFKALKARDAAKKEAALSAEWIYLEVPYKLERKLSEQLLLDMIQTAKKELAEYLVVNADRLAAIRQAEANRSKEERSKRGKQMHAELKEKLRNMREKYLASDKHQDQLAKAREKRRERYKQLKELRK